MKYKRFSFIEILIGAGIVAVLAALVTVIINPTRQFSHARDSQRWSDVNAILNAIHQRMVDNKGSFAEGSTCDALPSVTKFISSVSDDNNINVCDCLVDAYLTVIPYDPSVKDAGYTDCNNYSTGYAIVKTETGRITVFAPSAELDTISVTR